MPTAFADLVFRHGRIYPGTGAPVSALAVRGGRILATGGEDDADDWIGPDTHVIDLAGAAVLPGLVDVHNHHHLAGRSELFELTFRPTASFAEVLDAVRAYATALPADGWVIGGSIGSGVFGDLVRESHRRQLDEAAGGRPVTLSDDSLHNRFVSTRALELAGIGDDTQDPEDGRIVRDLETGGATGLLYEAAGLPVADAVARTRRLSAEDQARASERGVQILNSFGITAFQDAGVSTTTLAALKRLDEEQRLTAWVVSSLLANDIIFGESPLGDELFAQRERFRGAFHRPDFIKIFLDGVPPTETAAFLEPYRPSSAHGSAHRGETTMSTEALTAWLLRTAEQGLSAKIHCTGDASVRVALNAVEAVRAAGHTAPLYQVAHGQYVQEDDRARFAELGVSADISPFLWFPSELQHACAAVRPTHEGDRMQPNRALLDAGALVAGGSDWPVSESPNPWEGIQGLVTRRDPLGRVEGALWSEQAVSVAEAIGIFTANAAEAMGLSAETGSLEAGKSADLVVLTQDPYAVDPSELIRTRAAQTWFAGRLVYDADAAAAAQPR